jgi:hypothetical protein
MRAYTDHTYICSGRVKQHDYSLCNFALMREEKQFPGSSASPPLTIKTLRCTNSACENFNQLFHCPFIELREVIG